MGLGGEDFEVVEAVFGFAEEGALGVAEFFFGGFGAVRVQGIGPATGETGEEVGVVLFRDLGEVLLEGGEGFAGCGVGCFVQGEGDDGRGAGADGAGGEGFGEVFVGGADRLAGDSGPWQERGGEGEASAGFAGADAQQHAQVFGAASEFSGEPGTGGFRGGRPGAVAVFRAAGAAVPGKWGDVAPAGGPFGRCRGGFVRPGPEPVQLSGRDDLEVVDRPGDFLDAGREQGRGVQVEVPHGGCQMVCVGVPVLG